MSAERKPRVIFAGGGTGGHLYPAIALGTEFESREGGADVLYVGAQRGVEARVLPERKLPHQLLRFEPIRRSQVWRNWRLVPSLASILWGVPRLVSRFKPDLIVGTGGYASGPVVAYGILLGIPTALQEQNSYPGLVTRLLTPRVRQLHMAFPEALEHLEPGENTEVFELGNPIQPPDRSIDRNEARAKFGLGDGPVVLVMGGSQGAKAINDALLEDIRSMDKPAFEILWATGPNHFDGISEQLGAMEGREWVKAVPYIHEMPYALAAADVAISRAGAMALAELCAWGIPSILVPFPHAAANHQFHNAKALDDADAGVMITEDELESGRLMSEVRKLVEDDARRAEVAGRAEQRGHPQAASNIVDALSKLIADRKADR